MKERRAIRTVARRDFAKSMKTSAMILSAALVAVMYQYVDVQGSIKTISADSPAEALALPDDIHPLSGVLIINDDESNKLPDNTRVDM